jgi:cytochrome oxidase Cu insertion factor (SCO1/SenC/PrrC family)
MMPPGAKSLGAALIVLWFQAQDRPPQGTAPEVGKEAPGWKLKSQDGRTEVQLEKLKGRPVVLVFGSYT